MGFDQSHARGEVADLDAAVDLDDDLHPCSGEGNIFKADR
jgi:hypothetical protein